MIVSREKLLTRQGVRINYFLVHQDGEFDGEVIGVVGEVSASVTVEVEGS